MFLNFGYYLLLRPVFLETRRNRKLELTGIGDLRPRAETREDAVQLEPHKKDQRPQKLKTARFWKGNGLASTTSQSSSATQDPTLL